MDQNRLELRRYFPFYLVNISNRWTTLSSRFYLENFGIGIGEWRVLASAYSLGSTTSNHIANFVLMDAAAVSRSLVKLEKRELIRFLSQSRRSREKILEITDEGKRLYLEMRDSAYVRQEKFLQSLSDSEKDTLMELLKKISNDISELR